MVLSFKHRGPKALYDGRSCARVAPEHIRKLLDVFALQDRSRGPRDINLPGLRLHPPKGQLQGHYAASVSGNWRVAF